MQSTHFILMVISSPDILLQESIPHFISLGCHLKFIILLVFSYNSLTLKCFNSRPIRLLIRNVLFAVRLSVLIGSTQPRSSPVS